MMKLSGSGILWFLNLASSLGDRRHDFFLVAPDGREKEIVAQLQRPVFRNLGSVAPVSSLLVQLRSDRRFGEDWRVLLKVAWVR